MKKARMNISQFCFILFNLKIFGEIVTTNGQSHFSCPRPLHHGKKDKKSFTKGCFLSLDRYIWLILQI